MFLPPGAGYSTVYFPEPRWKEAWLLDERKGISIDSMERYHNTSKAHFQVENYPYCSLPETLPVRQYDIDEPDFPTYLLSDARNCNSSPQPHSPRDPGDTTQYQARKSWVVSPICFPPAAATFFIIASGSGAVIAIWKNPPWL